MGIRKTMQIIINYNKLMENKLNNKVLQKLILIDISNKLIKIKPKNY